MVIPAGFRGVFEVVEPVRKHYVIVERRRLSTCWRGATAP
jgi:hypothetical protein